MSAIWWRNVTSPANCSMPSTAIANRFPGASCTDKDTDTQIETQTHKGGTNKPKEGLQYEGW